jgi:SET domain-containing protein
MIDGKGRGLIATRQIQLGEIVIKDFCVEIPESAWATLENSTIWKYVYINNVNNEIRRFLSFGFSAFVNHSNLPNLQKSFDYDSLGVWVVLRALSQIGPGDELCIQYANPSYFGLD